MRRRNTTYAAIILIAVLLGFSQLEAQQAAKTDGTAGSAQEFDGYGGNSKNGMGPGLMITGTENDPNASEKAAAVEKEKAKKEKKKPLKAKEKIHN